MKRFALTCLFWAYVVLNPAFSDPYNPLADRIFRYPYDTQALCEADRIYEIAESPATLVFSNCVENGVWCWMPSNGQPPSKPR